MDLLEIMAPKTEYFFMTSLVREKLTDQKDS